MFFFEIAAITGLYCLVIVPAYSALCGIIKGKYESDIALAPRRAKVIAETEKLQRHFDLTTPCFKEAERLANLQKQEEQPKKKKKKRKKKPKERYDIEIIPD